MTPLPQKTRQLAQVLRVITLGLMAAFVIMAIYALFQPQLVFDGATRDHPTNSIPMWEIGQLAKLLLFALAGITLAAKLFTLWHMARLFGLYAGDKALTSDAAHAIRLAALGFLAQAALKMFGNTATGLILSIDAPDGHGILSIGIGTPEVGFALAGGFLLIIGVVMQQATAVARENESFV